MTDQQSPRSPMRAAEYGQHVFGGQKMKMLAQLDMGSPARLNSSFLHTAIYVLGSEGMKWFPFPTTHNAMNYRLQFCPRVQVHHLLKSTWRTRETSCPHRAQ